MHGKGGALEDAVALFTTLQRQNVVSWNFILRAHARQGLRQEVHHLFNQMQQEGVLPNKVTFVCIFSAYASQDALPEGKHIHARIQGSKFKTDVVVGTAIVNMYGKCGSLDDAEWIFEKMAVRDIVSWNAMIAIYAQHGLEKDALQTFDKMQHEALIPNKATLVSILAACSSKADLAEGRRVHSLIQHSRCHVDVVVGTALVHFYGKCGSMKDALRTFVTMPERNTVSWNAMISVCAQHGQREDALQLLKEMQKEGVLPDSLTFVSVLAACTSQATLREGMWVHICIVSNGLELEVILGNALINMYGKSGDLGGAYRTFDTMPERNVVSWSTIILVCAQNEHGIQALTFFDQMQWAGIQPNQVTFFNVLDACASQGSLADGKRIHAYINHNGDDGDVIIGNSLINMYAKCGSIIDAQNIFYKMPERDVISWNGMIAACTRYGEGKEALQLFNEMQQEVMLPNLVTFISILDACSSPLSLTEGKRLHVHILASGFESDVTIGTALLNMYSKCGSLESARGTFDMIAERNVVSWTAMIAAYAQHGQRKEAMQLLDRMKDGGVRPNQLTFISILASFCNKEAVGEWEEMNARILDCGFASEVMVGNALLSMYGKCGGLEDARMLFDRIHERDIISWNSMIAGYGQHGQLKEAVQLLEQMQGEGLLPNQVTFLSIIGACSSQLALSEGRWLHCSILGSRYKQDTAVGSALVSMYGKCGSLKDAQKVFNQLPEHDVVSWTAMIGVFAQHGQAKGALQLFDQMQQGGVIPNGITFSNIIAACSHGGLVHEALECFASMIRDFGISPDVDHYVCMIDLLGRAGLVDQAEYVINDMPFQPTAVPYVALLAACRQPADIERGERASIRVLELDPEIYAPYIMLSNMWAEAGRC